MSKTLPDLNVTNIASFLADTELWAKIDSK